MGHPHLLQAPTGDPAYPVIRYTQRHQASKLTRLRPVVSQSSIPTFEDHVRAARSWTGPPSLSANHCRPPQRCPQETGVVL